MIFRFFCYCSSLLISFFLISLRRITGLDPAGPLFFPDLPVVMPENHLSEKDASFVDIVHTDNGGYGYPVPTGMADFYVNSGYRFQPGCGSDNQIGRTFSNYSLPTFATFCSNFCPQVAVVAIIELLISGPRVLSMLVVFMLLASKIQVDGQVAGTNSRTIKLLQKILFRWASLVQRRPTVSSICKRIKHRRLGEAGTVFITILR